MDRPLPDDSPEQSQLSVEARWVAVDETPAILANQMIGQVHGGEIVLTFGYVAPPPILGRSLEEKVTQARQIEFLEIRPVARIALTPSKLREVAGVIQQTIANYADAGKRKGARPGWHGGRYAFGEDGRDHPLAFAVERAAGAGGSAAA